MKNVDKQKYEFCLVKFRLSPTACLFEFAVNFENDLLKKRLVRMDVRGEIQPFSDINALQIFPYPRYACSNLPAVNFESDLFTGKYRLREKGCAMRNTLNRLVTLTL